MFAHYKRFTLNQEQLKQLADFLSNLSLVFLTVLVVPVFFDLSKTNIFVLFLGLICTFLSLVSSLYILKERNI